ncbi:MAG: GNAT family N-acetyltransferase [Clostridiales bacterium]|nr:GNAT family N-acetyltransferase [Clostridiales bacterium]
MFNLEVFYVAIIGGKIEGITACTNEKNPSVRLKSCEFKRHLGFIRGGIAYSLLKKECEGDQYPFPLGKNTGTIEFVSVSPQHQGKGVGTELICRVIESTPYAEYALEVADTNLRAMKLYKKLGFKEFQRVKTAKRNRLSGINYLVYMKYTKRR